MGPERIQLFPYFIGIYVLAIALEAGYAAWAGKKASFSRTDTWLNIFSGIGSALAGKLFLLPIFFIYEGLYQLSPLELQWSWWAILLGFLLNDFFFYWAHRWSHTTHLGWATHVTHHSSLKYNLSVAVRQSWTQSLFFWVFLPMAVLGIPPEMVLLVKSVDGFYQFWVHTEMVGRLPRPIEFIFNTPSHHRVHHSSNPMYLDKNYGGIFIVWDRIFGTFQAECEEEPCVYGLTQNLESPNLLRVQFHVWVDIPKRLTRAKSFGAAWRTLYNAPGAQDDDDMRPPRSRVKLPKPAVKSARQTGAAQV